MCFGWRISNSSFKRRGKKWCKATSESLSKGNRHARKQNSLKHSFPFAFPLLSSESKHGETKEAPSFQEHSCTGRTHAQTVRAKWGCIPRRALGAEFTWKHWKLLGNTSQSYKKQSIISLLPVALLCCYLQKHSRVDLHGRPAQQQPIKTTCHRKNKENPKTPPENLQEPRSKQGQSPKEVSCPWIPAAAQKQRKKKKIIIIQEPVKH